ncbi:MFS transporter [Planococcus lenghuensis]|uniref:Major facilitator superfamily (MFS) profile domain-containing protein n=1 Tax=Planococcus lenghuensis TaxID=2213202 RepID=A0A1Q2KYB8_9BACL|nr:MFS transporter [Planococcus lenghuensis]AQQ53215.1 hypothetical protein B0X71_09075 [Planococcus lenghuensis]
MNVLPKNHLLSDRNFSYFFFGQSFSTIGDGFQQLALIYLIFDLGGGASELALSQFFLIFPRILVLLLGGVAVDRLNPKQIIWISDLFRFVVMTLLILFLLFGSLSFQLLYVFLILSSIASGFFYPAFNAVVPSLVEEKNLDQANAWVQSISQMAIFIGPPLAGLLVSNFGITAGFIVNALSYFVAAITGLTVQMSRVVSDKIKSSSIWRDIQEGFRQVWKEQWLKVVLVVDMLGGLAVVGPLQITLPVYSERTLDIDPAQMGFIVAAFGIGSTLGMIIAAKLKAELKTIRSFFLFEIMQGMMLFFVAIPSLWMVIVALAIVGVFNGISSVIIISRIQSLVPRNRLGRTMSIVSLASFGAVPISQLLTGWLSNVIPLPVVFIIASILLILSGLMGMMFYTKSKSESAVM